MLLKLLALGGLGYAGYRYYEKNRVDKNGVAFADGHPYRVSLGDAITKPLGIAELVTNRAAERQTSTVSDSGADAAAKLNSNEYPYLNTYPASNDQQ